MVEEENSEGAGLEQYYICRGSDDGRAMVECSQCVERFHCSCVNLSQAEAEVLEEYICVWCSGSEMLD